MLGDRIIAVCVNYLIVLCFIISVERKGKPNTPFQVIMQRDILRTLYLRKLIMFALL